MNITTLSCLLMSFGFIILIKFSIITYDNKNHKNPSKILKKVLKNNIVSCFIMGILYYLLCRVIILGFSPRAIYLVSLERDDGWYFLLVITSPVILHYIIYCLYFRLKTEKLFGVFDNMLGGAENAQKIKEAYKNKI